METHDFLRAVMKRHGIPSHTKLAAFLDIDIGMMSRYRNGLRKLNPSDCFKVARALDETPDFVMAEIQAEKAQRREDRAVWKRLANLAKKGQAAGLALLAIGAVCSGGLPQRAMAAPPSDEGVAFVYYVKLDIWII